MEQITIGIMGTGAERQSAALMKAIYKTMAKAGGKCQVTISTEHVKDQADELLIPEFMGSRDGRRNIGFGGR